MDATPFNSDRHQELNLYFKELINHQLDTDPYLKEQTQAGRNLDIKEITGSFSPEDQALWEEYLALDQQRMQHDLQQYLEGNGSSADFNQKFYRSNQDLDQNNPLW
ncbi:hypothetical protein [Rufibacter sp. LB8]|uniref:hypothetical protein n=1 Tax=Rufibacter sp. LB8 TaxID=2777781 RepID=UPI00178C56DF|nr:hypothetical protein [Rufibacter sp. LB8]